MLTLSQLPPEILASITCLLSAQEALCQLFQTGDLALAYKLCAAGITSLRFISTRLSYRSLKVIESLHLQSAVISGEWRFSALHALIMALPTSLHKLKIRCDVEKEIVLTDQLAVARPFSIDANPPFYSWKVKDSFPHLRELQIGDKTSSLRYYSAELMAEFFRGLPESLTSLSLAPTVILPEDCWDALPPHLTSLGVVAGRFPFNRPLLNSLVHLDVILAPGYAENEGNRWYKQHTHSIVSDAEIDLTNLKLLTFPPNVTQLVLHSTSDLKLHQMPTLPLLLTEIRWEMTLCPISSIRQILALMPRSIERIALIGIYQTSYDSNWPLSHVLERVSYFKATFEEHVLEAAESSFQDIVTLMPNLSTLKLYSLEAMYLRLTLEHLSQLNPQTMRELKACFYDDVFTAVDGVYPLPNLLPGLKSLSVRPPQNVADDFLLAIPPSITYLSLENIPITTTALYQHILRTQILVLDCLLEVDDYEIIKTLIERGPISYNPQLLL